MRLTRLFLSVALLFALALLAASVPVLAAVPAKSELAVSGSYANPKDSTAVYALDLQLVAPVFGRGYFLAGPKLHLDSDDARRAIGGAVEVNFNGTSKSGLFIFANGLYNVKDVDGEIRYTADAGGGLKVQMGAPGCVGGCGGFQAFGKKTIYGRGKEDSDFSGNVGVFVRF